jgi:hypothetical protein
VERNEEEANDLEIITIETNLLWAQYLLQVAKHVETYEFWMNFCMNIVKVFFNGMEKCV